MYDNGSVSSNIRYREICNETFFVNVAYNNYRSLFGIVNNTMKERNGPSTAKSNMPTTFEILKIFMQSNNLVFNWINSNSTWGIFDYDTGKWTGAVGQVNKSSVC